MDFSIDTETVITAATTIAAAAYAIRERLGRKTAEEKSDERAAVAVAVAIKGLETTAQQAQQLAQDALTEARAAKADAASARADEAKCLAKLNAVHEELRGLRRDLSAGTGRHNRPAREEG
jgi:hypothetical protein